MSVWSVLPGKTDQAYLWISVVLLCHLLASASCQNLHWLNILFSAAAAAAKSLQSRLTLCDPIDTAHQAPPVPGILQARTLEWVAISFSNAWKWKVKVKSLSLVQLFTTPWTAAHQAPPSMGFSRQKYWSGVPLPSPYCFLPSTIWCFLGPSQLIHSALFRIEQL